MHPFTQIRIVYLVVFIRNLRLKYTKLSLSCYLFKKRPEILLEKRIEKRQFGQKKGTLKQK